MDFLISLREKLTPKLLLMLAAAALVSGFFIWGVFNRENFFFNFWRKYNFEIIIPAGVEISQDAKTPDEAVRDALLVSGYEKENPSQVEALPDKNGQIEYWSIKTDKGYVTVKAKP